MLDPEVAMANAVAALDVLLLNIENTDMLEAGISFSLLLITQSINHDLVGKSID